MRNIASYYLHNAGFKDLWFMDLSVPCFSPVTNEPVHTILGAGNGSGKSTTISLIFSLFIPDRGRFLRTQKDSNFAFEDYFDKHYYKPGFVVVEFDAGSVPSLLENERERIIVGQAVCLSSSNSDALYRRFFAFRASGNINMQTLIKGTDETKGIKDIGSKADFKKWLKAMRAKAPQGHSASFYDTDNQQDWLKHLDSKGIDKLLTESQWRYNRREGGVEVKDENSFADHRDFLRRFIAMCFNESIANALKKNIENNIKNLAEIPRYEKQLEVFRTIEAGYEPFRLAAQNYKEAKASQLDELQEAQGLILALERKITSLEIDVQTYERNQGKCEEKSRAAEEDRINDQKRKRGFKKVLHEAKIRDNEKVYETALEASQRATDTLEIRKARKDLKDLDVYDADIAAAEEQLKLIGAEIKVFQDRAKDAGARYKSALTINRDSLSANKERSDSRVKSMEEVRSFLKQEEKNLRDKSTKATKEMAQIEARQEQAKTNRDRLTDEQIMLPEESGHEAVSRLQHKLKELGKEKQKLAEAVSEVEGQISELEQERISKGKEQVLLSQQAEEKSKEYTRGQEIAQELIEQLHDHGLIDTLEADLESPLIERKLDEKRDRLADETASLAIKKGALENDSTCVNRFQVLGVDHNVTTVTRALTDLGIDAVPYGSYLSGIFENDPDSARTVFLSDPARFSGVQVHGQDALDAAKNLNDISLDRPVVVSFETETPESRNNESVVVGHEGHALYNKNAAQEFSKQLADKIRDLERDQDKVRAEAKNVADWISRLAAYLKEFGSGKLKAFKTQEEQLLLQADNITSWLNDAKEFINDKNKILSQQKNAYQDVVDKCKKTDAILKRVQDYITDFESHLLKWEREYGGFQSEYVASQERLQKLERYKTRAGQSHLQFSKRSTRLEGEINYIGKLLLKIEHDSGEYHDDVGADYEPYQKVYEDAATALKAEEDGKIIDLTQSLKTKKTEHEKRRQEYQQNYGKFAEDRVRRVPIETIDSLINEAVDNLEKAQNRTSEAKSSLDYAKGAYKSYLKRWKPEDVIDADIDASLSQETIQDRIVEVEEEIEVLANLRDEADREAENLKKLAKQADSDRVSYAGALAVVEGVSAQLEDLQVIPKNIEVPSANLVKNIAQSQKQRLNACITTVSQYRKKAQRTHSNLMRLLESDEVRDAASYESSLMRQAGLKNYEAFIEDADDKARIITDRIKMLEENIARSEDSLQACAVALSGGVENGLRLLKSAVKFQVPEKVQSLGGQHILKISNLDKIAKSQGSLSEHLRRFIKRLVAGNGSIPSGHRLVADALCHAAEQMAVTMKVRILKPVPALNRFDHVDISSYSSSSGGEGLTSALMYYLLAAYLRGKEQAKTMEFGGALILDNPIGEANLPILLQAQREIASSLDIQLIYFTGIKDLESLQEFDHHVTLRPSQKEDRVTGRRYMEIWSSEMQPGVSA
ncbi:hypothetical protein [Maridesulfovibrio sp.]|uniref:hypothetical protein n=1 Tax=Maridesulfovibrio sp. TaxID=2795000 RepID=UPI003AFFFFF9